MNSLKIQFLSFMKRPDVRIFIGASLFLLGYLLFSFFAPQPTLFGAMISEERVEEYASEMVSLCEKSGYRPTCYDEEVPKLMEKISFEDAFRVTRVIQEKDPSYSYCHVLGHEISAIEVRKDPDKWTEVITRCPSGMCSNGCLHGGFQERFRAESVTPEEAEALVPVLGEACEARGEWKPTGLEQASCYHALGHLAMYITNAETEASLSICRRIAVKPDGRNYLHVCYDGVFMQIFQPLEPEDFALIAGKEVPREKHKEFCSQFSEIEAQSCWSEGWPMYPEIYTAEGLINFCAESPGNASRCINALIYVTTARSGFDIEKLASFCAPFPAEYAGRCFANSSSRMIETDYRNISKSVALCARAEGEPEKECFDELITYSTFNFHKGSPEAVKLCEEMPEPWKAECMHIQQ